MHLYPLNMKHLILISCLLALPHWLWPQQSKPAIPLPQSTLRVAVLGSLIYPGFKVGVERPYRVIRPGSGGKYQKERSLCASLGYYHHGTFHDNFFLLLERRKRLQWQSGWFAEFSPGLGLSRTFLGGATYTVSATGEVDKRAWAGHTYALVSAALGGGYRFATRQGKPVTVYSNISLLGMFPSNRFIYLRPTMELGLAWNISRLFPSAPTVKEKKK